MGRQSSGWGTNQYTQCVVHLALTHLEDHSAQQRELVTLAILIALGGTEPQVKGHVQGNLTIGNDRRTLVAVITQLLPWAGYPRTLTALKCLDEVVSEPRKATV